jgi:hypothetical protein
MDGATYVWVLQLSISLHPPRPPPTHLRLFLWEGQLAVNTALSASVMFVALKLLGSSLAGVWLSFMVFNLCRFLGAMWHHFMQGPLALHKRR